MDKDTHQIYHKHSCHRSGFSQFFIMFGIVMTVMGCAGSLDAWFLFFTHPASHYIQYLLLGSNALMLLGLISIRIGCYL